MVKVNDLTFTNQAAGQIVVESGTLVLQRSFTTAGEVLIGSGSPATFQAPGAYTQTAGLTALNGGTLNATAVNVNAGSLEGSGIVNGNVTVAGQIRPGFSDADERR